MEAVFKAQRLDILEQQVRREGAVGEGVCVHVQDPRVLIVGVLKA